MMTWKILILLPAFLWLVQLPFLLWNISNWKSLSKNDKDDGGHYLVSILIPARNEEKRLEACIHSLYAQQGVSIEVIVYNDQSTDKTGSILSLLQDLYPNLIVVEGTSLPEGWYGKPHACWELAKLAHGDWLLFIDADTRLQPDAVFRFLLTSKTTGADLISGFGRLSSPGKASALLTSLMTFVIAMHLPIRLVHSSPDPRFVAINGAAIFIRKSIYQLTDGHRAVKTELVEDMALGRVVKKSGGKVLLSNLTDVLTTEMYDNLASAWRGYRKNLFPGLGKSYAIAFLVEIYYTVLFLLPWVMLIIFGIELVVNGMHNKLILVPFTIWLSLWSIIAGWMAKYTVDLRFAMPKWITVCTPCSAALLMAVLITSLLRHATKRGYDWKGRVYS